ncbi:GNAT family N-acetyltransferase [Ciceribacter sp. L1K22]|uniref:GNAT family N-acetyltransferase n=1 Tax=Ciceribacter sp. L1K22 TaxID=2820275 RepID=UPI001ABDB1B7|nr:GNAT family N-acetyltransferase [Ciceribacter sp. L1K22]
MPGLRAATAHDIPFIMRTERLPGYDKVVRRFDEAEHQRLLVDPSWAYLIAPECGFAILNELGGRDGNVCLKRLAVVETGKGLGSQILPAIIDWTFENTSAHRFWLHAIDGNASAVQLYRKCGFSIEGVKREAALLPDDTRRNLIMMSILRPEWAAARAG